MIYCPLASMQIISYH